MRYRLQGFDVGIVRGRKVSTGRGIDELSCRASVIAFCGMLSPSRVEEFKTKVRLWNEKYEVTMEQAREAITLATIAASAVITSEPSRASRSFVREELQELQDSKRHIKTPDQILMEGILNDPLIECINNPITMDCDELLAMEKGPRPGMEEYEIKTWSSFLKKHATLQDGNTGFWLSECQESIPQPEQPGVTLDEDSFGAYAKQVSDLREQCIIKWAPIIESGKTMIVEPMPDKVGMDIVRSLQIQFFPTWRIFANPLTKMWCINAVAPLANLASVCEVLLQYPSALSTSATTSTSTSPSTITSMIGNGETMTTTTNDIDGGEGAIMMTTSNDGETTTVEGQRHHTTIPIIMGTSTIIPITTVPSKWQLFQLRLRLATITSSSFKIKLEKQLCDLILSELVNDITMDTGNSSIVIYFTPEMMKSPYLKQVVNRLSEQLIGIGCQLKTVGREDNVYLRKCIHNQRSIDSYSKCEGPPTFIPVREDKAKEAKGDSKEGEPQSSWISEIQVVLTKHQKTFHQEVADCIRQIREFVRNEGPKLYDVGNEHGNHFTNHTLSWKIPAALLPTNKRNVILESADTLCSDLNLTVSSDSIAINFDLTYFKPGTWTYYSSSSYAYSGYSYGY